PSAGVFSLESCRQALDRAVRGGGQVVEFIEEVERMPLMNYQEHKEHLLRVVVSSQKLIAPCRTALEKGLVLPGGVTWRSSSALEANVPLAMRFLVDVSATGGGWVEVPSGRFRLRPAGERTGSSQLEADAHYSALVGHRAEGEWMGLAPLRLMSLHLRTVGSEGRIVAAGAVLEVQGQDQESRHSMAWAVAADGAEAAQAVTAPSCSSLPVLVASEGELLKHLQDFVLRADPDVLLGYDLLNGHLSSAIARASCRGQSR
ncbi:unnamed protein product, partial [Polarella glacialis]